MTYTDEEIATGEWVRSLAENSPLGIRAFYRTERWRKFRREILARDHYACQRCKAEGRGYVRADTVHHIVHLKADPNLALTESNLISVCASCHDLYHPDKHYKEPEPITKERWD